MSFVTFDGITYSEEKDGERLGRQMWLVKNLMLDGKWRTLREIVDAIGCGSEAGVSARLRDLRKIRFGTYVVERQRRGIETNGLYEYRIRLKGPKADD